MNRAKKQVVSGTTSASWAWRKKLAATRAGLDQGWGPIRLFKAKAEHALAPYKEQYKRLQRAWAQRLRSVCGDLYGTSWEEFRPLRLSREEDWSDWLAWLLETSTTGVLAESLFGAEMGRRSAAFRLPKAQREIPTEDRKRRADIVVTWKGDRETQIEVKVGDEEFDKTFETSRGLRAKMPAREWYDTILIPDASKEAWDAVAEAHAAEGAIHVVLWSEVARGLRKCPWERREPVAWRAWAWAFCSAIEVQLLGLRSPDLLRRDVSELEMASRWVEVLAKDEVEVT